MCNIKVSVVCITYNHVSYIEQCLESLVTQKTNFPFEIIINDDCSTDGSKEIIHEWANRYPALIRPIFHPKNQFQIGVDVFLEASKIAKGKYIALCETDDYWLDDQKLQKQYDKMESDASISLCTHGALRVNHSGEKLLRSYQNKEKKEKYYTPQEIIQYDGGSFIASASMMYRREILDHLPQYYYETQVYKDAPLVIYLSTIGKIYYDPTVMSAYRIFAKGSWSESIEDKSQYLYEQGIKMLDSINQETKGKYEESINYRKNVMEKDLYENQKKVKALYHLLMRKTPFTQTISFPKKIYLLIRTTLPVTEKKRFLIPHPTTILKRLKIKGANK
ncbi:MAG: glycosyltransferase [Enterococcus sp.]|nr:glycosyltransferase [Enterococcus sp.]